MLSTLRHCRVAYNKTVIIFGRTNMHIVFWSRTRPKLTSRTHNIQIILLSEHNTIKPSYNMKQIESAGRTRVPSTLLYNDMHFRKARM